IAISITYCLALTVFYCRHTLYENRCYRASGKVLRTIQENVLRICQKENTPYLVLRQVPAVVAVTKIVSPYHLIVMDGKTGLLHAPNVPAGWVKETLRKGDCRNKVLRFDSDTKSLEPVDFSGHDLDRSLDARALAALLAPPLQFNKSVSLDQQENCL